MQRSSIIFSLLGLFMFVSCKSSSTVSTKSTTDKKDNGLNKSDLVVIDKAIKTARSYTGTKYKYGGTTKKGMDCSGLTSVSYNTAGHSIPRTSSAQSGIGKRVYIGELEPGDLIFFGANPGSKKITHVGMITIVSKASIKFIHASTKKGVTESELLSDWYKPRYIKAVRPLGN